MSGPVENEAAPRQRINFFSVIGLLMLIAGVVLFAFVSITAGIIVIASGVLLAVISILR